MSSSSAEPTMTPSSVLRKLIGNDVAAVEKRLNAALAYLHSHADVGLSRVWSRDWWILAIYNVILGYRTVEEALASLEGVSPAIGTDIYAGLLASIQAVEVAPGVADDRPDDVVCGQVVGAPVVVAELDAIANLACSVIRDLMGKSEGQYITDAVDRACKILLCHYESGYILDYDQEHDLIWSLFTAIGSECAAPWPLALELLTHKNMCLDDHMVYLSDAIEVPKSTRRGFTVYTNRPTYGDPETVAERNRSAIVQRPRKWCTTNLLEHAIKMVAAGGEHAIDMAAARGTPIPVASKSKDLLDRLSQQLKEFSDLNGHDVVLFSSATGNETDTDTELDP